MSQVELSELAGVSAATVKRLETSPETRGSAASLFKIERALEQAGVEFIPGDESKGPGVRLKKTEQQKTPRGSIKAPQLNLGRSPANWAATWNRRRPILQTNPIFTTTAKCAASQPWPLRADSGDPVAGDGLYWFDGKLAKADHSSFTG